MEQLRRVFVVTGSNKGIGFQTVRELCRRLKGEDATVVLCSRNAERGQDAALQLAKEGLSVNVDILDVSNKDSCQRFADTVRQKYRHVDCLVNNAGIMLRNGSLQSLREEAQRTCAVNYYGARDVTLALSPLFRSNAKIVIVAARMGNACLKSMNERNRLRIVGPSVNLKGLDMTVADYIDNADNWKDAGWPKLPYAFSKAAAIGLAAALAKSADAQELNPLAKGIIVTSTCPGWCKTDMGGWEAAPQPAELGGRLVAQLALTAGKKEHGKFVLEAPK